jgi:1-deoxy-D-xylulose-5-phosphate reductoisomerase
MNSPVSVSVVGSTGSVGTQTLDVIRAEPGRFRVDCIGAFRSIELLVAQAEEFRPRVVAIGDESLVKELAKRLPAGTELTGGAGALAAISGEADICVNGVVGFAGLGVTIGALAAGKRLALANKESLITAGPVVRQYRNTPGAHIVPVDSEHCAIHQCLASYRRPTSNRNQQVGASEDASQGAQGRSQQSSGQESGGQEAVVADRLLRLVLTASGGPFRTRARDAGGGEAARVALAKVTVEEALAHPTWKMGPKITIDSSTLFNKGLEVIEAMELFDVEVDRISVVVHPQSVVHSMAEFTDGTTMAQLSMPDMRLPIAYALAYPDRTATSFGGIDWSTLSRLDFEEPDKIAFPALEIAYEAGRMGGLVPAWVNAANEVAVAAFLEGRITWGEISLLIGASLLVAECVKPLSVGDVIETDHRAREWAKKRIVEMGN